MFSFADVGETILAIFCLITIRYSGRMSWSCGKEHLRFPKKTTLEVLSEAEVPKTSSPKRSAIAPDIDAWHGHFHIFTPSDFSPRNFPLQFSSPKEYFPPQSSSRVLAHHWRSTKAAMNDSRVWLRLVFPRHGWIGRNLPQQPVVVVILWLFDIKQTQIMVGQAREKLVLFQISLSFSLSS